MSEEQNKIGWFKRLKQGLQRSSSQLTGKISTLLTHRKLDPETLDDLEDILIEGDMGVETAQKLVNALKAQRFPPQTPVAEVQKFLAQRMEEILEPWARPLDPDLSYKPWVCLMMGVNGSGKTTTIGKLATLWKQQGMQVSLIAGDTFRAAAVEQLQIWGTRAGVVVKTGCENADAAGLIFEGLNEAIKRQDDVVLIDTAGRLHNKKHLMDELKKIVRVIQKVSPAFPHSCVLVLDGTTGQNAWSQLEIFQEAVPISGLVITKLDGTSRGGVVVGLVERFQIPLHAIGVGEGIEDLQPFQAKDFARQLMGLD